jgi:hypothetical protein
MRIDKSEVPQVLHAVGSAPGVWDRSTVEPRLKEADHFLTYARPGIVMPGNMKGINFRALLICRFCVALPEQAQTHGSEQNPGFPRREWVAAVVIKT